MAHTGSFPRTSISLPKVLEKHCDFDQDDTLVSFAWGPKTDDLEAELIVIPRIMILGFGVVNEMFDLNLEESLASLDAELRLLENPPAQSHSLHEADGEGAADDAHRGSHAGVDRSINNQTTSARAPSCGRLLVTARRHSRRTVRGALDDAARMLTSGQIDAEQVP